MPRSPRPTDESARCLVVLGDQLLPDHPSAAETVLIERRDLATRHRYHQARMVQCFASMRHHAQVLRDAGRHVTCSWPSACERRGMSRWR